MIETFAGFANIEIFAKTLIIHKLLKLKINGKNHHLFVIMKIRHLKGIL